MGAGLWDQLWLPLLIGVAIQIIVAAICFVSARLWKYCLMKQRKTRIAAGDGNQEHALSEVGATADANAVMDVETGSSFGSPEGGESSAQPDLEMAAENGGSRAQVTKSTAREAIVSAEVAAPQQRKVNSELVRNAEE